MINFKLGGVGCSKNSPQLTANPTTNYKTKIILYKEGKMASKYTLKAGSREFELHGYQSPRGLRNNDKRPTRVKVEVREDFDLVGLKKHIDYLIILSCEMENEA
ncbi:MAG: hypothetical protein GX587_15480 [Bacteroidales bacterium]|nr:hypothetical protein [Bacteroidales bacterium]